METGALIGLGVSTGVWSWGQLEEHRLAEGALISVGIALPLTLVVIAMSGIFFGVPIPEGVEFIWLFAVVAVVCGAITAINYAVQRSMIAPVPAVVSASPPTEKAPTEPLIQPVRLLSRLPQQYRAGPVIALEAEDHYLRVHTPAGSTLILIRLSDAITELDGAEGAQTHRSWWVARDAVQRVETSQGPRNPALRGRYRSPGQPHLLQGPARRKLVLAADDIRLIHPDWYRPYNDQRLQDAARARDRAVS